MGGHPGPVPPPMGGAAQFPQQQQHDRDRSDSRRRSRSRYDNILYLFQFGRPAE